jgi:predicted nuclease of predicted toxin-antitoxin system
MKLLLVWGQPPKIIRLKTANQTRAATLKLLIESSDIIVESLLTRSLSSIEIVT